MNAIASVNRGGARANPGRMPIVHCPVCNGRAYTRSSEELSPETRRLYYRCDNFLCSMTWSATLTVETVISPSGVSPHFRPAHFKVAKPPGHDFGQLSLLDRLASTVTAGQ